MINVVFLLCDQMLATSTSWPMDMLSAANHTAKRLCPDKTPFKLITTSSKKGKIFSHSRLPLHADTTLSDITRADIIYLPALWRNPRRILSKNTGVFDWLRHHYENGSIISGVGTGCCFMAEAGLLNHKPATTHWYYFDQFQKDYPLIQLKRQHFITQSGKLYCAASINSLADLTIYFIQQFYNYSVAQHIERHFSHEIRQAYKTVSYLEDGNINHSDEDILQTQLWMKANLDKTIKTQELARQFGMSTRNFTRRFREATGSAPLEYLLDLRISTAKDLLQSSNLSIGDIADKVSYKDHSHFTQAFRKKMSITPSDYRTTVRAKLFRDI